MIFVGAMALAWRCVHTLGHSHLLTRWSLGWFGLVIVQLALGAATVLTGKSADIATAHVAVGAVSLVTGALGTLVAWRLARGGAARRTEEVSVTRTHARPVPAV